MKLFNKLLGAIALSLSFSVAMAAGGLVPLDRAPFKLNDQAALQNGAKIFVNHCLNCHGARSLRYNRLKDIGLTDDQIRESLLFTGERVGDPMTIAMTPQDGSRWFGAAAPDLSVIARAKSTNAGPPGGDYIYTYMRTFYRDTTQLTGWNNLAFPNAGMPHVMWDHQGPREMTSRLIHQVERDGQTVWEQVTKVYDTQGYWTADVQVLNNYTGSGGQSFSFRALDPKAAAQYDRDMADLAAFMTWMGEPALLKRKQIGVWVLLFLGIFFVFAWRLNATYWKHVK